MGEAKRRGSFEQRQAEAVAKREAREKAWNEVQAERKRQRLAELERLEAARPKSATSNQPRRGSLGYGRGGMGLVVAAMLAASMGTK